MRTPHRAVDVSRLPSSALDSSPLGGLYSRSRGCDGSPDDLKRVLADEIRAAIAETAPRRATPRGGAPDRIHGAPGARRLSKAAEVLTPSVPAGAPLGRPNGWPSGRCGFSGATSRPSTRCRWPRRRARRHGSTGFRRGDRDELARRMGIQEARLDGGRVATPRPAAPGGCAADGHAPRRGRASRPASTRSSRSAFAAARQEIARGQRFYLELLRGSSGPGARRRLRARRVSRAAQGGGHRPQRRRIEPRLRRSRRARGPLGRGGRRPRASRRPIRRASSARSWRSRSSSTGRPRRSSASCSSRAARSRPGACSMAETINVDSLSALRAFYLDPTHVRPVPADALRFLAEAAGFTDARIEYRSPPARGRSRSPERTDERPRSSTRCSSRRRTTR